MVATMAEPAKKSPKKAAETKTESKVHFLQEKCMEVAIEISWLTTSRKVDDQDGNAMANEVGASRKALSISKRLYDSKLDVVKKLNAARSRLKAYINSYTIPVAAIPPEHTDDPEAFAMKASGVRMIMVEDIKEFDTHVEILTRELLASARALDGELAAIKANDKQRLGQLFDDRDYPLQPSKAISVRGPLYSEIGFRANFEELAPQACARAMRRLQQRLDQTVELASGEFCEELAKAAHQIASQLTSRMRLYPIGSHRLYDQLNKAELIETKRHDEDAEVPVDMVMVYARVPIGGSDKKTRTDWFGPMTEAEFRDLRSKATDEKCKVYESTVLSLREQLDAFNRISGMFGDKAGPIKEQVKAIEKLLSDRHGNPLSADKLIKDMRNTDTFRDSLQTALTKIAKQVEDASELVAPNLRKRKITLKNAR